MLSSIKYKFQTNKLNYIFHECKFLLKSQLFTINKASFLLIVLPYIGFNWQELYHSPYFIFQSFTYLIFILVCIEVISKYIIHKTGSRIGNIFLITFTIIFFYGNYPVDPIFNIFNKKWGMIFRGRDIVIFLTLVLIIFQYLISKLNGVKIKYFNVFLLIFSLVSFSSNHSPNEHVNFSLNKKYNNLLKSQKNIQEPVKPIILIIADEYSSPDNLYSLVKDSTLYNFSNELKNKLWIVRNSSNSLETSTIHSIGSIFNFNQSYDTNFKYLNMESIGAKLLKKSLLIDSINKKQINFINYGIFDINDKKAYSQLYIYPKSFTEQFLLYTTYLFAKRSSINFHGKRLSGKNEIIMEHNKYFISNINDLIENTPRNTFIYLHLFMPHAPLQYEPEFKRKELKNLNEYIEYWRFSNKKLQEVLNRLTKNNKFRIILTGDHGLRGMPTNPNQTFTAYYGFDSLAIKKINSVQDLGILINESF
jgi:hypothetical protein